MIPIAVGALGTVLKGFEKRLKKLEKDEGSTTTLRSAKVLRKALEDLGFVVTQTLVKDHQLMQLGKLTRSEMIKITTTIVIIDTCF